MALIVESSAQNRSGGLMIPSAMQGAENFDIDSEPPLRRLWNSLRRHRLLLAIFILAGLAAATLVVGISTPRYTAVATLAIEREKPDIGIKDEAAAAAAAANI